MMPENGLGRMNSEGESCHSGKLHLPFAPTRACDVGDAPDDRPVPAVWPRPTHVGSEKYLGGFWIIEASDLDVALKLAAEGSEACNRKVEVRRNAAKAAGRAYGRRRSPVVNPRMNEETKSHN